MPAAAPAAIELDPEEELGRYQDGLDGELDAPLEAVAVLASQVNEPQQPGELAAGHRPAIGPGRELAQDVGGTVLPFFGSGGRAKDDLAMAIRQGISLHVERSLNLDALHDQVAIAFLGIGLVGTVKVVEKGHRHAAVAAAKSFA